MKVLKYEVQHADVYGCIDESYFSLSRDPQRLLLAVCVLEALEAHNCIRVWSEDLPDYEEKE